MVDSPPITKIQFHYLKANSYRVIHADGAIGNLTPKGALFFSFFSERLPIPEMVVHPLTSSGSIGDEIVEERRSKGGIVRQLEVGVAMDFPTAESLYEWLGQRIEERRRLSGRTPEISQ